MPPNNQPFSPELLIAHGEWLRRLAAYLLRDDTEADDLVQETWETALRSPPDPTRPIRPWLSQVLRNAVRSSRRAAARRTARELAAGDRSDAEPTDAVLARLQLQARIARLMVELEEPYRTTLVLRFYDSHDATEIAKLCDVAPGTVRWRISEGVRRLRAGLDTADPTSGHWRAILAPLLPEPFAGTDSTSRPTSGSVVLRASIGSSVVAVTAIVLLVFTIGVSTGTRPKSTAVLEPATSRAPTYQAEEARMSQRDKKRLATFFGLALPALMAASSNQAALAKRVDLDFKDADIHNVLRLLSDAAHVNIWTANDVKGAVTIKVKGMPWDEAMAQICRDRGLHWQRNDNVVLISQAELKPSQTYVGKRIDIDFRHDGKSIDVREALATLAAAGQVKIEVADDVRATVSMRGRDMPWDQVLDVILWSQGLHAERHGDVIRVSRGP